MIEIFNRQYSSVKKEKTLYLGSLVWNQGWNGANLGASQRNQNIIPLIKVSLVTFNRAEYVTIISMDYIHQLIIQELRPLRSDQNQSQIIDSYFNCCYKCFDSFFLTHLPPLTTRISRAKLVFFPKITFFKSKHLLQWLKWRMIWLWYYHLNLTASVDMSELDIL